MGRENTTTLYPKIIPAKEVKMEVIHQMHELFGEYYNNAPVETFLNDLRKKDHVILVFESYRNTVVGFTTIKKFITNYRGRKVAGIFSGDTIMYKKYWGSKVMHVSFLQYVVTQKIKNPLMPLYWFLISKGYKTYLLLANNFKDYYPKLNGNQKTDEYLEGLTEHFCELCYPNSYNSELKILDFGQGYQNLKSDVAEITPELTKQYPKIGFFEEVNPGWRTGHELACVGEMSFDQFAFYGSKLSRSVLLKSYQKVKKRFLPALGT